MNLYERAFRIFGISVVLSCLMGTAVNAAPGGGGCTDAPPEKAKASERFESSTLFIVAKELESQGEKNFHLKHSTPSSHCIVETFLVGDVAVSAGYSPWEKGLSTLLYEFSVSRPDGASEIQVLYSGTAGVLGGAGFVFHVSEERQGIISWYAMFNGEPAFADVKALVEKIVRGDAKPLLAVTWREGAKEGDVVAFDTQRLK
ncbi:hypothetical protein LNV08_15535 [Paucibacter sp. TC2R-5]|uniref:hypothetical protein n=1 Tax=Paucibacter sp. TC2R-5 TaxID=2893555 RepID=UPI0021E4B8AD|nr:hypothetical protein [Paucibacter sp. TC2R-5]MCV2360388.1 hypothetical protein [Paucibacter sp. TC2R-5]